MYNILLKQNKILNIKNKELLNELDNMKVEYNKLFLDYNKLMSSNNELINTIEDVYDVKIDENNISLYNTYDLNNDFNSFDNPMSRSNNVKEPELIETEIETEIEDEIEDKIIPLVENTFNPSNEIVDCSMPNEIDLSNIPYEIELSNTPTPIVLEEPKIENIQPVKKKCCKCRYNFYCLRCRKLK